MSTERCSFCGESAVAGFVHTLLGAGASCAACRRKLNVVVGEYDWLPFAYTPQAAYERATGGQP